MLVLAAKCHTPHASVVAFNASGEEKDTTIRYGAPEFFYYALADGIQKLFTRFGKWNAKLDLGKVLVKPSPQLEFAFAYGDG